MAFEEDVRAVYEEMLEILPVKHAAYGPTNLVRRGPVGILVRMDDKLARLENLLAQKNDPAVPLTLVDSIEDACKDLIGYATLLLMYERGQYG